MRVEWDLSGPEYGYFVPPLEACISYGPEEGGTYDCFCDGECERVAMGLPTIEDGRERSLFNLNEENR